MLGRFQVKKNNLGIEAAGDLMESAANATDILVADPLIVTIIRFCRLLIPCYLLTFLSYLRTLYMYLLYTPDNAFFNHTSCTNALFNSTGVLGHCAILIWREGGIQHEAKRFLPELRGSLKPL